MNSDLELFDLMLGNQNCWEAVTFCQPAIGSVCVDGLGPSRLISSRAAGVGYDSLSLANYEPTEHAVVWQAPGSLGATAEHTVLGDVQQTRKLNRNKTFNCWMVLWMSLYSKNCWKQ